MQNLRETERQIYTDFISYWKSYESKYLLFEILNEIQINNVFDSILKLINENITNLSQQLLKVFEEKFIEINDKNEEQLKQIHALNKNSFDESLRFFNCKLAQMRKNSADQNEIDYNQERLKLVSESIKKFRLNSAQIEGNDEITKQLEKELVNIISPRFNSNKEMENECVLYFIKKSRMYLNEETKSVTSNKSESSLAQNMKNLFINFSIDKRNPTTTEVKNLIENSINNLIKSRETRMNNENKLYMIKEDSSKIFERNLIEKLIDEILLHQNECQINVSLNQIIEENYKGDQFTQAELQSYYEKLVRIAKIISDNEKFLKDLIKNKNNLESIIEKNKDWIKNQIKYFSKNELIIVLNYLVIKCFVLMFTSKEIRKINHSHDGQTSSSEQPSKLHLPGTSYLDMNEETLDNNLPLILERICSQKLKTESIQNSSEFLDNLHKIIDKCQNDKLKQSNNFQTDDDSFVEINDILNVTKEANCTCSIDLVSGTIMSLVSCEFVEDSEIVVNEKYHAFDKLFKTYGLPNLVKHWSKNSFNMLNLVGRDDFTAKDLSHHCLAKIDHKYIFDLKHKDLTKLSLLIESFLAIQLFNINLESSAIFGQAFNETILMVRNDFSIKRRNAIRMSAQIAGLNSIILLNQMNLMAYKLYLELKEQDLINNHIAIIICICGNKFQKAKVILMKNKIKFIEYCEFEFVFTRNYIQSNQFDKKNLDRLLEQSCQTYILNDHPKLGNYLHKQLMDGKLSYQNVKIYKNSTLLHSSQLLMRQLEHVECLEIFNHKFSYCINGPEIITTQDNLFSIDTTLPLNTLLVFKMIPIKTLNKARLFIFENSDIIKDVEFVKGPGQFIDINVTVYMNYRVDKKITVDIHIDPDNHSLEVIDNCPDLTEKLIIEEQKNLTEIFERLKINN